MSIDHVDHRVAAIQELYTKDPEGAHGLEDGLLWDYIRERASLGDWIAVSLMTLEHTERTRHYDEACKHGNNGTTGEAA